MNVCNVFVLKVCLFVFMCSYVCLLVMHWMVEMSVKDILVRTIEVFGAGERERERGGGRKRKSVREEREFELKKEIVGVKEKSEWEREKPEKRRRSKWKDRGKRIRDLKRRKRKKKRNRKRENGRKMNPHPIRMLEVVKLLYTIIYIVKTLDIIQTERDGGIDGGVSGVDLSSV